MPRPRLQTEEIEQFRERLCDTAMQLFAERGYRAVTLRSLAAELGCSYAMPYRYFSSKDEIFAAVRALGFERFAVFLEHATAGVADPEQRWRLLSRAYLEFAETEPAAFRIMFELEQPEASEYPQLDDTGTRAWEILLQAAQDLVAAGVVDTEPLRFAHLTWAGMHGLATLRAANRLQMGATAEELVDPLIDALLEARRPRTHAVPPEPTAAGE